MPRLAFVVLLFAFVFSGPGQIGAQTSSQNNSQAPHLLRNPALSDSQIAFRYADDIWTVAREGGPARRLTSTGNVMGGPFFSPDGRTIA